MSRSNKRKSRRRQSKVASFMIVVTVVTVCVVSGLLVGNLRRKSKDLAQTEYMLEQRLEQANLDHENLLAQEQYMKTNQYVEDVAKEKLGMVYPDEIVIRPKE
ncbi:MAG: cell division protein FtsL [Eubacteriales bacterium]|nr:cell division protein FtsL [Lachnospiraceae bacterium]MDO5128157.1 cell division protein FtsL [Eubacteriales bacterium]